MRPDTIEHVVLVDPDDRAVGHMEKLTAHREGRLHRAFSVFIFDGEGRLLLQRRARGKYHSPGLWSNTCCGHPRPGEEVKAAAQRRLMEEMGLRCVLDHAFTFIYHAELSAGLCEHELDHVFVGSTDIGPRPHADEVGKWRFVRRDELDRELDRGAERFSAWLPLCVHRAWDHYHRSVRSA